MIVLRRTPKSRARRRGAPTIICAAAVSTTNRTMTPPCARPLTNCETRCER
ncbi:ORF87 peptide [Hyphantria cunea nucleopolyhedrovirus]|uniref:ORF87 peptide n=1 Tax=Hyphantria cunea nuclear polyhedrosis virus TaxID=28288 RepID=Q2NP24_NPVHC|nr:ORF87 peptide [Hyphantria cunea nucleopolyhedrovirus]BAE72376.1 ORF87 peptide [Hyphantria cunea nucleopolyhedrovirus]